MKKQVHILFHAVAAVFVVAMVSCAGASMKKESMAKADSVQVQAAAGTDALEAGFESDTLNALQLQLFQERSREKVQDLINYVEIIANKSYNSELRKVASEQVYELFSDSSVSVDVPLSPTQQEKLPLPQFLKAIYSCDYDSIRVTTDSITLHPFQTGETIGYPELSKPESDTLYLGYISGKLALNGYKYGSVVFSHTMTRSIVTRLSKSKKQFGDESKQVWTTTLGSISPSPVLK